jgi:transposase
MEYWDRAPLRREQILLFPATLDESISEDHPVRLLDELLRAQDWSAWEREYDGTRGRPPIPPWVMAGVILYGLMRSIRSSRVLEYLCTHNIDYIWLVEGRTIDYTTICKFRTRFRQPLKDLFRQVGKLAMRMGLVKLLEVAFDGTRVKANASRFHTWTAERVEAALKELESLFDQAMAETERTDAAQVGASGAKESPGSLPPELATAKARQAKLQELLAELKAADEARRKDGIDPKKSPAQRSKADTDAPVMPNKEGGYAPNYTPLAATDTESDFIVDCDVVAEPNEHPHTLATVDHIEKTFGEKPQAFSADTAHSTGGNLAGMEQRGVAFYSPVESPVPQEGNPAKREDPRQPVPEAEWPKLPRNNRKKLAKSCFPYDAEADCYYCPMGRVLSFEQTKREEGREPRRVYRSRDCGGCRLSDVCRDPKSQRGRSVSRDPHEPLREQMCERLKSVEGKAIYGRRMHTAETPFGHIKAVMGVRQFLLRGLEKVRTEWLWVCTAYNLKKLLADVGKLRAVLACVAAEAVG